MRDIKFRAWDENPAGDEHQMLFFDLGDDGYNLPWLYKNTIIMQYTGLKDKNGTDVYEGDILTAYPKLTKDDTFKREVVWHVDGYYLKEIADTKSLTARLAEVNLKMEVVGNIYEN